MNEFERSNIVGEMHAIELRLTERLTRVEVKLEESNAISKDVVLMKIFLAILYVVVIGKIAGINIGSWV